MKDNYTLRLRCKLIRITFKITYSYTENTQKTCVFLLMFQLGHVSLTFNHCQLFYSNQSMRTLLVTVSDCL